MMMVMAWFVMILLENNLLSVENLVAQLQSFRHEHHVQMKEEEEDVISLYLRRLQRFSRPFCESFNSKCSH